MGALTDAMITQLIDICLLQPHEDRRDAIDVEGIVGDYRFSKRRIAAAADTIGRMLAELPDQYRRSAGGGWSFLNLCQDRHGNMWTGLQLTLEALCCLGIACGRAGWLFPREMWPELPGSMPYVWISIDAAAAPMAVPEQVPEDLPGFT